MQLELTKEFRFEASHILPKHPGKCSRLHGHSWVLRVSVKGKVDKETGFVMDYADLKKVVQPLIDSLDHRHLGQWDGIRTSVYTMDHINEEVNTDWQVPGLPNGFYPSSENLIVWIADKITPVNPIRQGDFNWSKLELDETCTSRCILTREDYDAGRR